MKVPTRPKPPRTDATREQERRWYAANKDRLRAKKLEFYRMHKEQCNASARRYKARNREKVHDYNHAYHIATITERREAAHAYALANPERRRATEETRRARKAGVAGSGVTVADWAARVEEFCGRCAYCGKVAALTQDHVVPLSAGGPHHIDNVVPACKSCNSRKRTQSLVVWLARGGLRVAA